MKGVYHKGDLIMDTAAKINSEMQKHPNDLYREIIGHYLIDRASGSVHDDACIGAGNKTLEGALSAVKEIARGKAIGGVAVVADKLVFDEIDRYFGLSPDPRARSAALAVAGGAPASVPSGGLGIDLEDLL